MPRLPSARCPRDPTVSPFCAALKQLARPRCDSGRWFDPPEKPQRNKSVLAERRTVSCGLEPGLGAIDGQNDCSLVQKHETHPIQSRGRLRGSICAIVTFRLLKRVLAGQRPQVDRGKVA